MRSIKFCLLVFSFAVLSAPAFPQKNLDKPLNTWSKDDAMKIAWDSPWVQTYRSMQVTVAAQQQQLAREARDSVNRGGNGATSSGVSRGGVTTSPIVIRLHSAMPVRQAIVRLRQLDAGYDKMNADAKKQFDDANRGFLECAPCKSYYVISIGQISDSSARSVEDPVFRRSTLNDLKGNVWLVNGNGERKELFQFTPPKNADGAAYFFFSRESGGTPYLKTGMKNLKLVFSSELFPPTDPYSLMVPRQLEFDLSKIVSGDQIIF